MTRARAAALLAAGCVLAAAAAASGPLVGHPDKPDQIRLGRLFRLRRVRDGTPGDPSAVARWLDLVVGLVVLVAAIAVMAYLLWQFARALRRLTRLRLATGSWRGRTGGYEDEVVADDAEAVLHRRVRDELVALSAELDTYPDAREAVIACYVRMERALADAGSARLLTESPLELLARVLAEQRVPEADVRRLTDLFTEARFSTHPVTDDMRAAARRSLAAIADALAVPA